MMDDDILDILVLSGWQYELYFLTSCFLAVYVHWAESCVLAGIEMAYKETLNIPYNSFVSNNKNILIIDEGQMWDK